MDPMLFSVIAFLFWTPAVLCFFLAIFSNKKNRKPFFILSLISFLFPFGISTITRINHQIIIYDFQGTYTGIDSLSHTITVEIESDNKFMIIIDDCEEYNTGGAYEYLAEYDAFLFYTNNEYNVQINTNNMVLQTDIITVCCNLKNVKLTKSTL